MWSLGIWYTVLILWYMAYSIWYLDRRRPHIIISGIPFVLGIRAKLLTMCGLLDTYLKLRG